MAQTLEFHGEDGCVHGRVRVCVHGECTHHGRPTTGSNGNNRCRFVFVCLWTRKNRELTISPILYGGNLPARPHRPTMKGSYRRSRHIRRRSKGSSYFFLFKTPNKHDRDDTDKNKKVD